MRKVNFHTHTNWCDGADSARAMCEAAVEKGFEVLGFSSHVDLIRDLDAYVAEITALKAEFRGRLEVLCGIESEGEQGLELRSRLDYVIGSFHYVTAPDESKAAVDHSPAFLKEALEGAYHGDARRFVQDYFAFERAFVATCGKRFDFLAHPDLIRKFNVKHPFFDETADWYKAELVATADAIAAAGVVVEVNTGAISRGWLDDAYPSPEFRMLLRERGVKFLLSADAHSAAALDCAFDRFGSAEDYRAHW